MPSPPSRRREPWWRRRVTGPRSTALLRCCPAPDSAQGSVPAPPRPLQPQRPAANKRPRPQPLGRAGPARPRPRPPPWPRVRGAPRLLAPPTPLIPRIPAGEAGSAPAPAPARSKQTAPAASAPAPALAAAARRASALVSAGRAGWGQVRRAWRLRDRPVLGAEGLAVTPAAPSRGRAAPRPCRGFPPPPRGLGCRWRWPRRPRGRNRRELPLTPPPAPLRRAAPGARCGAQAAAPGLRAILQPGGERSPGTAACAAEPCPARCRSGSPVLPSCPSKAKCRGRQLGGHRRATCEP